MEEAGRTTVCCGGQARGASEPQRAVGMAVSGEVGGTATEGTPRKGSPAPALLAACSEGRKSFAAVRGVLSIHQDQYLEV